MNARFSTSFFIAFSFLYALVFCCLRLFCSLNLNSDGAEQILNATTFEWGYPGQAPLFSWLLFALEKIFGFGAVTFICFKYLLFFLLLCSFHFLVKTMGFTKHVNLVSSSIFLLPLYAHQFHVDLTHSLLLTLLAILTCINFFDLREKRDTSSFLLFAFFAAAGVLAKYNFALLLLALFFFTLFDKKSRSLFGDLRAYLAFFFFVLLLLPHFNWLQQNEWLSLMHAVKKSAQEPQEFWSLSNFLNLFLKLSLNLLIMPGVFLLVYFKQIKANFKNNSALKILLFVFLILLVLFFAFKMTYFATHWLAVFLFLLPLALFACVDLEKLSLRNSIFLIAVIISITTFFTIRLIYNFMPDLLYKPLPIQINSSQLAQQLKAELALTKTDLLFSTSRFLLANLEERLGHVPALWYEEGSEDFFVKDKYSISFLRERYYQKVSDYERVVIVWDARKKTKIPKVYRKLFPALEQVQVKILEANYLRSKKHKFKLAYAVL